MIKTNTVVKIDTESAKVGDIYKIKYPDMVTLNVLLQTVTREYIRFIPLGDPCSAGSILAKDIAKYEFTKMKIVEDIPTLSHSEPVSTQYRVKPDKKCAADYIPKNTYTSYDEFEKELIKAINESVYKGVVSNA